MTTAHMTSESAPVRSMSKGKLYKLVIASSIGNALEWFDLIVYGFFAMTISKLFFPSADETVSLLMALGTFAVSYLIRPLGAAVLGSYADRVGRKSAMLASIWLMMLGTLLIAIMPTYASIGIWAPIGIFLARLIQGFSAGGEFGSATALLVEHAPKRKGLMSSFMFASQGLSALLASGFGLLLTSTLTIEQLESWGWRIPFLFGLLIGPIGLYIRRHIDEAGEFKESERSHAPVGELFKAHKYRMLLAVGALVLSTSVSYVIIYMPTYAVKQLGLTASIGFAGTLLSGVVLTLLTPFIGHLSDIFGRTRIMLGASVIFILSIYPAFSWLAAQPTLMALLAVLFWMSVLKAIYFGGLPALMAELFPTQVRATGMALSYNIGTTIFGSFTPFIVAWLIGASGNKLAPSFYLLMTGMLSLVTLLAIRRQMKKP
ncbi:MFS transporter [Pseudomonas cichorii]|uniref:MFS transporter n=1 Tax=Pseudomonas serbiensis TaxID=3064350 RepID=A0ABT9CWK8_9PSED|nr:MULTISPECIES: MFS transporter [Pseudomonas]MDO7928461.1 MFS transporter [Pseudomonas sp. KFB-138]GFM89206.1 MFS transporter [Pseudomonas cichorii]